MHDDARRVGNRLLAALGKEDWARIEPLLERTDLDLRTAVERPNEPIKTVYFPETALLSVIVALPRERQIEVGVIGCEGTTGYSIVQEDHRSPFLTIVQVAGTALAMPAPTLGEILQESPQTRRLFLRYARAFSIQVASTALANGRSKLEDRLARWLLMASDRVGGDRIELTHEFLAIMLGVRRSGVTDTLHTLEGKGLIWSQRGAVVIRDREGLVELADGAYGLPEDEYHRLMKG